MSLMKDDSRMRPTLCVDLLARHALFSGASLPALQTIVEVGWWSFHRPGQSIVSSGLKGTGALLLIDGTAEQLDADGNGTGLTHGPGTLLAPMCMFAPTLIDHTVIATSIVETLELSRTEVRSVLQRDAPLARLLASRIENQLTKVAVALRKLDTRLERMARPVDLARLSHTVMGVTEAIGGTQTVPGHRKAKQAINPGLPNIRNLAASGRHEGRAGPNIAPAAALRSKAARPVPATAAA